MIKQKSYSVDFKELPRNGKLFEQFVRELLLILGVHPHWTGQGADHGTDILATEQIIGPMSLVGPVVETHRKWLVQCKHFAHSRRSVGRKDTGSIVDDCRQVGANAYLLVCSTQPSSSLVTKLEEISTKPHNNLVTLIWDSVDLEKMLRLPKFFALGHLFFPKSFASNPWKLFNREGVPSHWTAHYKSFFLHLGSRIAGAQPNLTTCELFINRLESVTPKRAKERLEPRAIYFDDKNGHFIVFGDYLVPFDQKPTLKPSDFNAVLQDGVALCDYTANWDIQLRRIDPGSDHFHLDHDQYYRSDDGNFWVGNPRGTTLGQLVDYGDTWPEIDSRFV